MSHNKVKWGVLGYARIAKSSTIPAIIKHEESEFYAIASRSPAKLAECMNLFSCHNTYLSYIELLDDPYVDAVYIPLPNSLHKEWTIKAMERGKHVLCEKPICLSSFECEQMIEAAIKNKVLLMEGFMYRYSDRILRVSEILNSKLIGEIKYISSTYRFRLDRPNTIKINAELGGGSLYDVGCYPVNFVGMILDELPSSYKSERVMKNGVDVIFSGLLKYKSGVIAVVNSGFNAYETMYSEIIGTNGIIEIPDTFSGEGGAIRLRTSDNQRIIKIVESDRFLLEISHFANAILSKQTNLLALEESQKNTVIIENLMQSAN